MEYLNLTTITLALSGMLIHFLMFVLQKTKGKNKFQLSVLLQDSMNWIRFALALISTFALLVMLDDIAKVFGMSVDGRDGILKIIAFTAGYLNHSLIKNILRMFK